MKKSFIFGTTALALAASLTAPVAAHAATNNCPTYIYSSAIDEKLCDELFLQLRDTLNNCEIKYGAVIVNGSCIQIPSDGTVKPDKPENTPPENDNSGNTESKPEDSGSGSVENKPGNNGSGDTENKPEDNANLSFAKQVVELVNKERAKAGVSPLTIDTGLESAALVRTKEIQTSFSHTRPNGSSFATAIKEAGISYRRSGENIAWGQRTPEAVVNAWMNSDGHRANILNPNFGRIGVGYLTNASGTPYWVQLFAD